jgi:CBS domain-containing protein
LPPLRPAAFFCCVVPPWLELLLLDEPEPDFFPPRLDEPSEFAIICGEDDRLKGMLTDRDIVVKALAQGKDPGSTKAGELGQGDSKTVTIGADDSIDEALRTLIDHKVRRLPVIDGKQLVGIISQADIATNVDEEKVGDLVEAISAAP